MTFLTVVSTLLGWLYTVLWSFSFWPQAIVNYRRKSTAGFSSDFAHLNVVGFVCYAIFNLSFLLSPTVQSQYRQRHEGNSNVVRWNDAAFATHAAALATVQMFQTWIYPKERGQKLSRFAIISLSTIGITVGTSIIAVLLGDGNRDDYGNSSRSRFALQWLDVVNLLSLVKLYITFVKYPPQMLLNVRRKSTRGFSIENILLDFSGGVLSLLQLVIDAGLINHDWSGVTGDFGKLGLALLSLFFDLILITQHYVFFGDNDPQALTASDEGDEDGRGHAEQADDDGQRPTQPPGSDERQPLLRS